MAMAALLIIRAGPTVPQLSGCDSPHIWDLKQRKCVLSAAADGLVGRKKEKKRHGFCRRFDGRRSGLPRKLLISTSSGTDFGGKFGCSAGGKSSVEGEAREFGGQEAVTESAKPAQGMTLAGVLEPLASVIVGLALGAALFSASGGQKCLKQKSVTCFASISTVAVAKDVVGPKIDAAEKSEINSEVSEDGPLDSVDVMPDEKGSLNLSVESVSSSPVEENLGTSNDISDGGSQEKLPDGNVSTPSADVGRELAEGGEEVEEQESVSKAEEADDGAKEVEGEEVDDTDDEYDEEDELEAIDVEKVQVQGVGGLAVTEGVAGVGSSRANGDEQGESGSGVVEDSRSDLTEEEEELRQAFEEWKSKPYALTVPLKIVGLRSSVPPVWLKDFLQTQGKNVKLAMEFQGSLKGILAGLAEAVEKQQLTPRSVMAADLVTVGDSWLGTAVAGGLIEPIEDAEQHEWFHRLGHRWQALLRRNDDGLLDSKGKMWGVPYRWGTLVIAYRKDKLKKFGVSPIKDWVDLFQPEFEEKIAMVDSPREVVGMILKSLGNSFNTKDFEKEVVGGRQAVKERFLALQKQVRLFDSVQYLKALGAGDVWVAVGWSSDVIPFAKRTSNIEVVVPSSGTSLWADLWAIPATRSIKSENVGGRIRGPSPLIHQWFDFCTQPARALSFKQDIFVGASPLALPGDDHPSAGETLWDVSLAAELKTKNGRSVKDDDVAFLETPEIGAVEVGLNQDPGTLQTTVPEDVICRSEFLEPLSDTAVTDFQWLLEDVVEVSGWPSDLLEFFKAGLQNFQKWIWARGIRY